MLMEAAPAGVDVDAAGAAICSEEGVRSVHDLHIWTVTSGFGALAAHVVVSAGLRPGTWCGAGSSCCCTSASGSTTPRCRWRRRPPADLLHVENASPRT